MIIYLNATGCEYGGSIKNIFKYSCSTCILTTFYCNYFPILPRSNYDPPSLIIFLTVMIHAGFKWTKHIFSLWKA